VFGVCLVVFSDSVARRGCAGFVVAARGVFRRLFSCVVALFFSALVSLFGWFSAVFLFFLCVFFAGFPALLIFYCWFVLVFLSWSLFVGFLVFVRRTLCWYLSVGCFVVASAQWLLLLSRCGAFWLCVCGCGLFFFRFTWFFFVAFTLCAVFLFCVRCLRVCGFLLVLFCCGVFARWVVLFGLRCFRTMVVCGGLLVSLLVLLLSFCVCGFSWCACVFGFWVPAAVVGFVGSAKRTIGWVLKILRVIGGGGHELGAGTWSCGVSGVLALCAVSVGTDGAGCCFC